MNIFHKDVFHHVVDLFAGGDSRPSNHEIIHKQVSQSTSTAVLSSKVNGNIHQVVTVGERQTLSFHTLMSVFISSIYYTISPSLLKEMPGFSYTLNKTLQDLIFTSFSVYSSQIKVKGHIKYYMLLNHAGTKNLEEAVCCGAMSTDNSSCLPPSQ